MIVSGLVMTTHSRPGAILEHLAQDARVEVGLSTGAFIPIVLTTETLREARDACEAWRQAPGVANLQLVSWTDEDALEEDRT
jgi:hypothetical protein